MAEVSFFADAHYSLFDARYCWRLRHQLHDFLGGVGHRVAGDELEAARGEGGFAGDDVVALEADDEGDLEISVKVTIKNLGELDQTVQVYVQALDREGFEVFDVQSPIW